ncbi:hypothetical protein BVC80_1325g7 [Macleaya cordata]|uniref:Uncharacterized protein n=1 Tax=Macleaya cordata TaxID=56857 RepID=A0A200PPL0_MACCD|nr:hypothetical protein BVC80_1325g7 [Macleaya cordata]
MWTVRYSFVSIVMVLIILVISSIEMCAADTILLRNKLGNGTEVMVACHAFVDWRSYNSVASGVEELIKVPYNERLFRWRPSYCTALWTAKYLKIYRSYTDHEA